MFNRWRMYTNISGKQNCSWVIKTACILPHSMHKQYFPKWTQGTWVNHLYLIQYVRTFLCSDKARYRIQHSGFSTQLIMSDSAITDITSNFLTWSLNYSKCQDGTHWLLSIGEDFGGGPIDVIQYLWVEHTNSHVIQYEQMFSDTCTFRLFSQMRDQFVVQRQGHVTSQPTVGCGAQFLTF